jgi:PAS domain S-box-containing protein
MCSVCGTSKSESEVMDDSSAANHPHRRTHLSITPTEQARLLDLSNDAIIVRDVNNRIIYWNHGATEIYGWTRDEAIGQDLHHLLHTEFEIPLEQLIIRLHQHDRMEGEVVQVTRDGRRRTLWSRWALDRDADGRPGAILTTYNDITARKQLEAERERLYEAERAARTEAEAALKIREQFLSIASHELRTPLTALIGFVHLLSTAGQNPDRVSSLTVRITQQTQRLNTLINQMLDVSRLQHGQFVLERQMIDLSGVVVEVVEAFRAMQELNPHHPLEVHTADASVLVLGDPHRLEQVLHNLLSNAVKYSPAGGVVRVRVGQTATDAIVEVADQGIGISLEAQARLFEPFYRAQNVGQISSGFGLGLHIVGEIVQRHGGRMEVESTEGQGSTFRVLLPRHTNAS